MEKRPARTLVLLPSPLAGELLRLAHDWVAAWVADPFLVVVLGDGSVGPGPVTPDVTARVIGRDGSVQVDLLDELGERPTDLLRIVGISMADDLLGADGTTNRDEALRVERMLQRSASSHNRLAAINLVVAETAASGLDTTKLLVPKWDINVLASPENRTGLRAFDAFARRSRMRDLNGFILAHALTVGGLWSGMASAPYDSAPPRRATDGVDLQRVSVRGVLAQDFMVQMAQKGLTLLTEEETPLRDPVIRAQFADQSGPNAPTLQRLLPVADERVDEAVGMLTAFVLDGIDGKPLRYGPRPLTHYVVQRTGAWESVRRFGTFSVDKFRVLPRWAVYRVRTGLQRRTGRTLHGEEGADLVVTDRHPFGDAAAFEQDIADALALRQQALNALASPPAITAVGPDTYAHLWSALRQGALRLLDGGPAPAATKLDHDLTAVKLDGALPNGSLICPDARDPWSPHPEVAALVEAETRDLRMAVGWLDAQDAARWSEVLEELAVTYDERVAAVEIARRLVAEELVVLADAQVRNESDLEAAAALLALDEHDHGPILAARIDAALAGVDSDVRVRLVPPRLEADPLPPIAPDENVPVGEGGVDGEVASEDDASDDDAAPSEPFASNPSAEAPPGVVPPAPPAFDRDAAEAWRILLGSLEQDLANRRTRLVEQEDQLAAEHALLEQVHPVVTEDLLTLRAWRWRLERSFAGRLVHALKHEQLRLDEHHRAIAGELEREHEPLAPVGNLYERFVRRMTIGLAVAALLTRLLWRPILAWIGVEYGEDGALVAEFLGVPAYPFLVLFILVVLWALLDYHRRWSKQKQQLEALRHQLRQLPDLVQHVQRERVRTFELHRQARELLRILSEVIHRPFLLDGVVDALPSSRSLDPRDLPKVVRFSRPDVDETWTGETRFVQRILSRQLCPGWRSEAYDRLLAAIQTTHGIVRGDLDAERVDRDPSIRTAVVEHLLLDDAQRAAGIARVREVLDDILGWQVKHDFPYPVVRVVRVERDPVDVRTDMFADGSDEAEEWQGFLRADVAADEQWAPSTFAAGYRSEYRARRTRIVHAPQRFHGDASAASVVAPRPGEVRPAEIVVRIDVLPDAIAIDRVGAFATAPSDGYDQREQNGDHADADLSAVAAELGASRSTAEHEVPGGDADDDGRRFNF